MARWRSKRHDEGSNVYSEVEEWMAQWWRQIGCINKVEEGPATARWRRAAKASESESESEGEGGDWHLKVRDENEGLGLGLKIVSIYSYVYGSSSGRVFIIPAPNPHLPHLFRESGLTRPIRVKLGNHRSGNFCPS